MALLLRGNLKSFAMDLESIYSSFEDFRILQTRQHSQTGVIRLEPGGATGEEMSRHPDSEQIILVLEGEMMAHVGEERKVVGKGQSLIIGADVEHRLTNEGDATVFAFTVYAPPAYPPGLPRH